MFKAMANKPGFPIEKDSEGKTYYRIASVAFWIAINPKSLRFHDKIVAPFRHEKLQASNAGDKSLDKNEQDARLKIVQRQRLELQLKKEKGILVDANQRDEDEVERFNIIKRRQYEAARQVAPTAMTATTVGEMVTVLEGAVSAGLQAAQADFIAINAEKAEEAKKPTDVEDALEDEEKSELPGTDMPDVEGEE
jgi:hypothetical protein